MVECADGSLYCGITTDVARRVGEHNAGRGARYTASRRPVRLAYVEEADGKPSALRRELEIKRARRIDKLCLTKSMGGVSFGEAKGG